MKWTIPLALLLIAATRGGHSETRFALELDGACQRWVHAPGALLGFWGSGDLNDIRMRTGANAFSVHHSLIIGQDADGRPVSQAAFTPANASVRFTFEAHTLVVNVAVLVSTAFDGATAQGRLLRLLPEGEEELVCEGALQNARRMPWLMMMPPTPAPPGRYAFDITPGAKRVEVWPVESTTGNHSITAEGKREGQALTGWVQYGDGSWERWEVSGGSLPYVSLGAMDYARQAGAAGMQFGMGVGEHNNPFFIRYPGWFLKGFPDVCMEDRNGKVIDVSFSLVGDRNPITALDDPTLTGLSSALIGQAVQRYRACKNLAYWVIAGEECYPDYIGLRPGDFRPASLAHYDAYRILRGLPAVEDDTWRGNPPDAWFAFRERAFADRAATYMQTFLKRDDSRPIFFPTCGNPFFPWNRRLMGQGPGALAGACDGFETGQILIDDDAEVCNLLTLAHFSAYGVPVVTPRLANKTLDSNAQGGGRSFSPAQLRRLVYECLGMGVWHIGLVDWEEDLPDGLWHIKDTPAEAEARQVFSEIARSRPMLTGMARMQPRVGLWVSDATWRGRGWNPRWTAFFRDALAAQWNLTIVTDSLIGAGLADRIPVLVSLENPVVARETADRMAEYLQAGGSLHAWGALIEQDAHGEAITPLAHPNLHGYDLAEVGKRGDAVLVNSASTASGAHTVSTTFRPLDFRAIEEQIVRQHPRDLLAPLAVSGAHRDVTLLPLTDGRTLCAVLINKNDEPAALDVKLPALEDDSWSAVCLDPEREAEATKGGFTVLLPAQGSTLVWAFPARFAEASFADGAIARASSAVERWKALGADLEATEWRLAEARKLHAAGVFAKAASLACSVTDGLGLSVRHAIADDGGITLRVEVYGANGQAVPAANVCARLVPDTYRWRPLVRDGGDWSLHISPDGLPRTYDLEGQTYKPVHGSLRVLVRARYAGRTGGAMVTLSAKP